jgi:hypothetical protein
MRENPDDHMLDFVCMHIASPYRSKEVQQGECQKLEL